MNVKNIIVDVASEAKSKIASVSEATPQHSGFGTAEIATALHASQDSHLSLLWMLRAGRRSDAPAL
jgi:hypothetical protein